MLKIKVNDSKGTMKGNDIPDGTIFTGFIGLHEEQLMFKVGEKIYSLDPIKTPLGKDNFWTTEYIIVKNYKEIRELIANT